MNIELSAQRMHCRVCGVHRCLDSNQHRDDRIPHLLRSVTVRELFEMEHLGCADMQQGRRA